MKRKKDIHVLYIITKLELGGAQKVCLSLFNGLLQSGYGSTLVAGANGMLTDDIKHHAHLHIIDILKREFSLRHLLQEIKSFFAMTRLVKEYRKKYPHLIVHTHSTKAGIAGRWAAFFAGVKTRIHTVHGYAFHPYQNRIIWLAIYLLELLTSLITTHYVCVSSRDVKTSINLFPRFSRKHSIIRAAIDMEHLYTPAHTVSSFPTDTSSFIFGTIACFKPQKNLFDLLTAFKHTYQSHPHTRLEIIGDGILRPMIEQWIQKHQLHTVITLHGWQHTIAPIIRQWHAFALSSLWEGLPCAIVEARLLHLPVISYDTGGIHDVITHGVNGLLYQPKDVAGLTRGMKQLCSNKELFEKLRMHKDDLHDFSTPHMVQQHIHLYSSLLRAEKQGKK